MTTLNFTIEGDFITQHSRSRIFERGWEDALRFLIESLIDFPANIALDILSGKSALKGINNVTIVKEKIPVQKQHAKLLNWHFAGTVQHGTDYYRPYAYVDNWGEKDIIDKIRTRHYADNSTDIIHTLNVNNNSCDVLWKKVPPIPVWMQYHSNLQWQEALDEYLSIGRKSLEHRGHQQWYPDYKPIPRLEKYNALVEPEPKRRPVPDMPPEDTELAGDAGFILPNGKFYACKHSQHQSFCYTLLYSIRKVESPNDPEKDADLLGWIKIGYSFLPGDRKSYLIQHESEKKLTNEQSATLIKFCEKHNCRIPWWFTEEKHEQ